MTHGRSHFGHSGHGTNSNWGIYVVVVVVCVAIFVLICEIVRRSRNRSRRHLLMFGSFFLFVAIFLCFICEVVRRHRKRKRRSTNGPTVTVTTSTQAHHAASPQMIPPYPIDARHPTPANNAPAPGFTGHQPPYPTHAPSMPFPQATGYGIAPPAIGMPGGVSFINGRYPRQTYYYGTSRYPYSMAITTPSTATFRNSYYGHSPYPPSGHTPYPPAPYPPANDYSANPPPYDVAVSQPPIQPPPSKEGYGKQSPYNPGYN